MKRLLSLTLVIILLFSAISLNVAASNMPSDWALIEINNAKNAGIITTAITRNYQKDITREEFCELVVKLYEKLTNQTATAGADMFDDTDNQEVLKAYSLGIVKGVSSNEFAPYNNITRQEICVMLTRCIDMAIDGSDITSFTTNSFADRSKIANWAVDSVDYAFDNNIIKGIGENKIDPLGNTTCEQAILLAYRIFANKNNLIIFDNLEEEDLEELFSIKVKINTSVEEYTNDEGKININSLDTVINKVADVSKELKENNEILDYNKDENTVWLRLNSGLQFVYVPEIEGYDLGGNNISIMTYQPFNSDYGTERPDSGDMERGIEATDGSAQNISNKFSKYHFTQNYDDGQVTLDSLKQIGSNQIILWHGHGGYNSSIHSFLGIGEQLDETKFLWDPVYYIKNIKYTGDYLSGRIVCLSSGNIGVTSKFFTKYLPQMSNTLVYLGTCESAHDSVLVDSFINKGATTVIGNSATIYTQYNQKMIKSTCDGLMMKNSNSQYNTILEAQNYAKSLHGNTDGSEYGATPIIFGNQSLRLSYEIDDKPQTDIPNEDDVAQPEPNHLNLNVYQKAIDAGSYSSAAIQKDGSLWIWGRGLYNYNGGDTQRLVPEKVIENDVTSVSVGDGHIAIVKNDGSLWTWGHNEYGQLGYPTTTYIKQTDTPKKVMDDVAMVSTGGYHTLILKKDGTLWGCGNNDHYELGQENGETEYSHPVFIMDNIVFTSGGYLRSFAIKSDGSLWAWGHNENGMLGKETESDYIFRPTKIMENIAYVSSDRGFHSIAIKDNGDAYLFGEYPTFIDGEEIKIEVDNKLIMRDVKMATCGDMIALLKTDGTVWVCDYHNLTPQKILDNIVSISSFSSTFLAVSSDGGLWSWGDSNEDGALGTGTTEGSKIPIKILENVR